MGDYHTTYRRGEGESTQWEDIQRRQARCDHAGGSLAGLAPAEARW